MANVLKSNDKDEERNIDEKILQLEMLTYNFHESLNLLPLFEYLDRQNNLYTKDEIARQLYKARLIKLAKNISSKQTSTLEAVAQSALFTYEDTLISYKLKPEYKTDSLYRAEIDALYENSLDAQVTSSTSSTNGYVFKDSVFNGSTYDRLNQIVRLKVVDYNYYSSTVKVRMSIQTQYIDNKTKPSAEFYVSYFEFPLIDNTRLENDMRLAIVLRNFEFDDGDEKEGLIPKLRIELKAIYFPGSKSGLKDKPYIDDIVSKLVKNRQN